MRDRRLPPFSHDDHLQVVLDGDGIPARVVALLCGECPCREVRVYAVGTHEEKDEPLGGRMVRQLAAEIRTGRGECCGRKPAIGARCFNGGQHDCIGVVDEMSQAGPFWIDRYEASRVDATPADAGVSEIRSCSQPGVLPWTGITRDEAAMQCAKRQDSAGAPMRLCDEGEWQAACKPVTDARPFWSMQPNPSAYDPFICNGAERALGAAWPGGTGSDCYALDAGGPVYDLSGNVAEWTATAATAQDYYAGGGHYQSGAPEMSCGIALVVPAGSRSPGLGFRCCADHGP